MKNPIAPPYNFQKSLKKHSPRSTYHGIINKILKSLKDHIFNERPIVIIPIHVIFDRVFIFDINFLTIHVFLMFMIIFFKRSVFKNFTRK